MVKITLQKGFSFTAMGGSSRLLGHLPGNHKVPVSMPMQLGLSAAAVVSLGEPHCLSHPAVKPGILCVTRAQLKSSFILS